MSGYNITTNPRNFSEKPIYAKTAPNFEANTIALNVLNVNQGWEIKPVNNQLNISYNGQSVYNIPDSTQQSRVPTVQFILNGKLVTVQNPDPAMPLANYIRYNTPFTATKIGCQQGGCGICTVMLSYKDTTGVYKNVNINSCLVKLVDINGLSVTTNDGIGSINNIHPIQKHFSRIGGFQCGFCTAGMIMSIYTAFQTQNGQSNNGMSPFWSKSEKLIDGNLCRCTGFRPIVEVYKTLMVTNQTGLSSPYINYSDVVQRQEYQELWGRWKAPTGANVEKRILPIYNPVNDTKNALGYSSILPLTFPTQSSTYSSILGYTQYNVVSMDNLINTIRTVGDISKIQLVQGQLQRGVPGYEIPSTKTSIINVSLIPGLHTISTGTNSITLGAGVKIAEMWNVLSSSSSNKLQRMADHIYKISGHQVRNWGSWVGGVMAAKYGASTPVEGEPTYFYSDMALLLQAAGATLNFTTFDSLGTATNYTNVDVETFLKTSYIGLLYVTSCTIPYVASSIFRSYRQAMRPNNSHAVSHMGIQVTNTAGVLSDAKVYIGGFGSGLTGQYSSYYRFTSVESYINGKTGGNLVYSDISSLIDSTLVNFTPEIVCERNPLALAQTFRRELFKGFFVQWIADMKASATYLLTYDKQTAFGYQDYVSPTGGILYSYANNIYSSTKGDGLYKYNYFDEGKATGQTKFTNDYVTANQLWLEPIIATQNAPFQMITCTGPRNILSNPANPAAQVPFTFTFPAQLIDLTATGTINAIRTAESMYGVKLVLSGLTSLKPNIIEPSNYLDAALVAFDGLQGLGPSGPNGTSALPPFLPGGYNSYNNTYGANRDYSMVSYTNMLYLSGIVCYIGQTIGAVVAETKELAEKASQYISENIVYIQPNSPVNPIMNLNGGVCASTGGTVTGNYLELNKSAAAVLGVPLYSGDINNIPSAVTQRQLNYYTGTNIVGNFNTVYSSLTGPNDFRISEGKINQQAIDHFTTERAQCFSLIPLTNGQFKMVYPTQMGGNAGMHAHLMASWVYGPYIVSDGPYSFANTGKTWYSPSGPARFPDGSLVYDPTLFKSEIPNIGGHFGGKSFPNATMLLTVYAGILLKAPIMSQPKWGKTFNDFTQGGVDGFLKYSMGFDNSGKIKALSGNIVTNLGMSTTKSQYIGTAFTLDEQQFVSQDFNYGAFQINKVLGFSNKASNTSIRSITANNGSEFNSSLLQITDETLKARYGTTGSYLSNVLLKNLVTPYSPFVLPTPPGFPKNIPVDNFGYPLINPLSQFNDLQAPWDAAGDSGREQGYWFTEEFSQYQVLQSVDRKINELYYTTGAITIFNPNGYTGNPLPIPVSASYTGTSYSDVEARFPAIRQLEKDVNQWNARPENRFRKLGVGCIVSAYTTTAGTNVNETIKLTIAKDGQIVIESAVIDAGTSGVIRLVDTLADELYLDKSFITSTNDGNILDASGITSAGSIVSSQYARAATQAADKILREAIQAIYIDLTSPLLNFSQQNLRNVIPQTGSYDIRPWTGAPYSAPYQIGGYRYPVNEIVSSFNLMTPGATGGFSIIATGPYGVNYAYKYVGTGAGNTGPALYPNSFFASARNFYSGQPAADNLATQGWPTQADVDWVNGNRELQILTLVRYAQQKGMGDVQLLWSDWNAKTQEQKKQMLTSYWKDICVGLGGSSPSASVNAVGPRYPISYPGWFFGGGFRNIVARGTASETTITPPSYYYPIYAVQFANPALAGLASVLNNFFYLRTPVAGVVLTEVDILSGQYNEIDAFISMDCGQAINPLNVSTQLEGAYLMGRSFYLQEQLYFNTGTTKLLNPDTWEYKPVSSQNTPQRISSIILNNPSSVNQGVVNKMKMIGEPGILLSAAALAAVRAAIGAYRRQENLDNSSNANNVHNWIEYCASPLTINKIKNVCPLPSTITF